MDAFGKAGIVIYAASPKDRESLPDVVREAVFSPDAGKYIPRTVVVNPDISEVIAIVPYAREESERKKLFADAFRKIAQYAKDKKKRTQAEEKERKKKGKEEGAKSEGKGKE